MIYGLCKYDIVVRSGSARGGKKKLFYEHRDNVIFSSPCIWFHSWDIVSKTESGKLYVFHFSLLSSFPSGLLHMKTTLARAKKSEKALWKCERNLSIGPLNKKGATGEEGLKIVLVLGSSKSLGQQENIGSLGFR